MPTEELTSATPYLTAAEVSRILGIPEPTLRVWRSRNRRQGPAFVKMGRMVRYPREHFERWRASLPLVAPDDRTAAEG